VRLHMLSSELLLIAAHSRVYDARRHCEPQEPLCSAAHAEALNLRQARHVARPWNVVSPETAYVVSPPASDCRKVRKGGDMLLRRVRSIAALFLHIVALALAVPVPAAELCFGAASTRTCRPSDATTAGTHRVLDACAGEFPSRLGLPP